MAFRGKRRTAAAKSIEAIAAVFDGDLNEELGEQEEKENALFKKILKRDFKTLLD